MQKHLSQNKRVTLWAIATGLFLAIIKGTTGILTGSLAMLASALDSILDTIVSTANLFVIIAAAEPPDHEHRYGHGKFEAFAELGQGILIGASALYLAYEAIIRLIQPSATTYEVAGISVMVVATAATLLLTTYMQRVAKQTNSLVVKADSAHYLSDVLANIAVIMGLILALFFEVYWLDALISIGIAGIILHSAWQLLHESYQILTDHALPADERKQITDILDAAVASNKINGWHMLRTRHAGSERHIDFHMVFDQHISLHDAHDIAENIERNILKKLPGTVILTHLDPHDDSKRNEKMVRGEL